jgi:hypothetical protein
MTRPPRLATLLGLALALLALGAPPALAAEPIEGTWAYQGGRVVVEVSGPGTFRGTVTSPTRFLDCDHPAGERMWSISSGSGHGPYAGTHQWFESGTCEPAPGGQATWTVREQDDVFFLDFCTAPPGGGEPNPDNPNRVCSTLRRAKPPATSPERVCLVGACIVGPGITDGVGCVARGDFRYRFRVILRGRARKRFRTRIVTFKLDGRRNGHDRRRPFYVFVEGSRLTPGSHVLTANVLLRNKRNRRPRRLSLKYTFNACD